MTDLPLSAPRLAAIADAVGTPVYAYSADHMVARYRRLAAAVADLGATICYALKANSNQAVIATFAREGAGADVVSLGEMRRALAAGVQASRIVFAGVGKTAAEMAAGLEAGIHQFSVESESELRLLSQVAVDRGQVAPVAIRVNPDVDARTHAKITTGRKENKFGIDIAAAPAAYALARALPGVEAIGVGMHIGSQLLDLAPFEAAFGRMAELVAALRAAGHRIERLDMGGGLGIRYTGETAPDLDDYAAVIRRQVGGLGCHIILEPGRWLVGEAGVLLTRVIHVKEGESKRFVIVDAAMNDLIRPTLYEAVHDIVLLAPPRPPAALPADVVGPVCESSDYLGLGRDLPAVEAGDLLAIAGAGAYGAVMSSTYNSRPLVPEVLARGNEFAIVRPRPPIEDLIAADRLPEWLR
ncbi:MAG: diaminopimelate decarboxylase [Thalassobaculales bacterium]